MILASMALLANLVTVACVPAGVVFFLAGTVGLLRFPDSLTRLHALTKADNVGLALIVLGLLPQAASLLDGIKMVAIWLLVQLASGAVAQLLAEVAHRSARAGGAGE